MASPWSQTAAPLRGQQPTARCINQGIAPFHPSLLPSHLAPAAWLATPRHSSNSRIRAGFESLCNGPLPDWRGFHSRGPLGPSVLRTAGSRGVSQRSGKRSFRASWGDSENSWKESEPGLQLQSPQSVQSHFQQQRQAQARTRSSGSTLQRPVVKVNGLRADDIRHPLDRQNTALLKAIPGLNEIGRMLLGPVQEQILVLENLGSGVHVTQQQLPALHALMLQSAELLQMPAPDLYVRQNPVPNAYTLAITGRKPFVVVHTALLDLLSPAETQAVLAHELGHLKCDHGIWLTFANLIALGAYSLPGGLGTVIAQQLEEQLMRWLRAAELTCDRAALVVVQDPRVVVSALMKLAGGSSALAHELSVDAFLEQARSYDEAASSSPLSWYLRHAQTRQLSHPLPVLRAREIDRWARSPEYKALLERGKVLLPAGSPGHHSIAHPNLQSAKNGAAPVQPANGTSSNGAGSGVNGAASSRSAAATPGLASRTNSFRGWGRGLFWQGEERG